MKCGRCGRNVSFFETYKDIRPEYATPFGRPKYVCEDCLGWNGKKRIPDIKKVICYES